MSASATLNIEGEPIAIRSAVEDDLRYVMQTWVRSYKPHSKMSNHTVYEAEHPKLVKRILADKTTRIAVACSPDIESKIHGWACGDDNGLHYAYVPMALRGHGIARALIESVLGVYPTRIEVTHRFHTGSADRTRFVYNPYRLGLAL